jgi:DUF971 family protein
MGAHSVRVVWSDGHCSEYPNRYLRDHCPCAECRELDRKTLPLASDQAVEVYAIQIGVVGRYAVNMQWSDGHDSGIYSYPTLRGLCPCESCQGMPPEGGGEAETVI